MHRDFVVYCSKQKAEFFFPKMKMWILDVQMGHFQEQMMWWMKNKIKFKSCAMNLIE